MVTENLVKYEIFSRAVKSQEIILGVSEIWSFSESQIKLRKFLFSVIKIHYFSFEHHKLPQIHDVYISQEREERRPTFYGVYNFHGM